MALSKVPWEGQTKKQVLLKGSIFVTLNKKIFGQSCHTSDQHGIFALP